MSFPKVWTPTLFVLLWSTGLIGARLGLPYAGPLTFLSLRYALAAALLIIIALLMRAPWPQPPTDIAHYAVAGFLVHGVYLGGVFVGIWLGVEAGLSALIVSLQPLLVLVAALAGVLLGERVSTGQWIGFALGFAGIGLILFYKLDSRRR